MTMVLLISSIFNNTCLLHLIFYPGLIHMIVYIHCNAYIGMSYNVL